MEQARKRLVELLTDIDYITSKGSTPPWWNVTVGAINKNYSKYKYIYILLIKNPMEKKVYFV